MKNDDGECNFSISNLGELLEKIKGQLVYIRPCKELNGIIPFDNFVSDVYVKDENKVLLLGTDRVNEETNIELHIDNRDVTDIKLHSKEIKEDYINLFAEIILNSGNTIQILCEL